MKTRIEFDNVEEAIAADCDGGRYYVREDGKVFWYSIEYLPTPILMDAKGNGTIMCKSELKGVTNSENNYIQSHADKPQTV